MSARFIIAYYKDEDGKVSRHRMYEIDYNEAREKWPDMWSLDAPKKGVDIEDRVPRDPSTEKPDEQLPPGGGERVPHGMGLPAGVKV